MPSTFLTCDEIAREALARLNNNLVMANLVNKNYSNEFSSKGDTVQIKKPATFTATEFSSTVTPETIVETKVDVKLDKIADVTVEVTSKEMTLNIADFGSQVIEGAVQALAQKIDEDLLKLYIDIPYFTGLYSDTPDSLTDIAACLKALNTNKAPLAPRSLVINPAAQASLIVLDGIVQVDASGSSDALRNASMGRIFGMDSFMDQNVVSHQRGTFVEVSGNLVTTASAAATSIAITNASCAGTLLKGDLLKITKADGSVFNHVITGTTATAAANSITVSIYPAVPVGGYSAAVVLVNGSALASAVSYANSLAFHKDAFCLVNRPMELPMGGATGAIVNYNGLSIRVTQAYTQSTKINTISFDILYGVKVLSPERAVRLIGKI
jgi:hypothetical protein